MKFNYIQDMIRSGVGEEATLIKEDSDLNAWGSTDESTVEEENHQFLTIVDSLNQSENEQEAGDFIEGDIRFYVSEECDLEFEHGDIIIYDGDKFDVDTVRKRTIGKQAKHKEVIAESI